MASYTSNISNLEREIASLRQQEASEAKKAADLISKQTRAHGDALRATSHSTAMSKAKEAERAARDLASVQKKMADIGVKIASKGRDLRSYVERQAKEDETASKKAVATQKKLTDAQRRMIRDREDHERRIKSDFAYRPRTLADVSFVAQRKTFDFFISHASEDKGSFVKALADELTRLGASIFYDEATLKVGDSLRRKIDEGLSRSKFGVVVLSEHFFKKEWPQRELDGLVALETQGATRILPIWHKISKDEVAARSPTLADKVALNTSTKSVAEIAQDLFSILDQ